MLSLTHNLVERSEESGIDRRISKSGRCQGPTIQPALDRRLDRRCSCRIVQNLVSCLR